MFEAFNRLPEEKRAAIISAGIKEFASKSYVEASTDRITADCGISKGLLFHYFHTKREFYLYCLQQAMETITTITPHEFEGDFYGILFASMDSKMRLCANHPDETRFVNMASRENAVEVKEQIQEIFRSTYAQRQAWSEQTMANAVLSLNLKVPDMGHVIEGLLLYTNAIINRFLVCYQETPNDFFENTEAIKSEVKSFLDLMLYGICEEDKP